MEGTTVPETCTHTHLTVWSCEAVTTPMRMLPPPPPTGASTAAPDTRAPCPTSSNDVSSAGAQRKSTMLPAADRVSRWLPLPWMDASCTAPSSTLHSRQGAPLVHSCSRQRECVCELKVVVLGWRWAASPVFQPAAYSVRGSHPLRGGMQAKIARTPAPLRPSPSARAGA